MGKQFRLPDSGQARCYDRDGREVELNRDSELWGEDGCFVVNPMSFTKLGNKGKILSDGANWEEGYRMVQDNNTGLVWEVKSPVKGDVNFTGNVYSWADAQKSYIKKLNTKKYSGFSDWRLPNKDELKSIIDYGMINPAVDALYFPHCQPAFYWSSIPYNMEPPFIWGIFFGLGAGICYTPSSLQFVRAVRSGYNTSFGNPNKVRLQDNGDATITDITTGLMWQKDENERMDWYSALKACKEMRLAGYTDWRLPNIKELHTILNLNYSNSWWYYKDYFPAKGLQPPLLHYFSSTSFEGIYAWVTNFCFGYDGYYAGKGAKLLFRAVRNIEVPAQVKKIFTFPHTGQLKCYNDEGKIIPTPKKGQRFYGQDGSLILGKMSFSKLRENAKEAEESLTYEKGLRLIRDNNTGLIWEVKSVNPADFNFKGNKYTWDNAKEYVNQLNKRGVGGFTDWRLPHREELRTIVDYNGQIPAVNLEYFRDTMPAFYWAADVYAKDPKFIWGVYFAYGCAICFLKNALYYVRAVRGGFNLKFGDPAGYALKDDGGGTISDVNTNLMWLKEESPEMNWEDAMKYCQDLGFAGYRDWRLPNIREIATLIDLSFKDNCWHFKGLFPNVKILPQGFYWSSTTYGDTLGWGVNFQFGYDGYYAGKRKGKYPFRPVRTIK